MRSRMFFSVKPREFPSHFEWNDILNRRDYQYVIDLPFGEWGNTAVVNARERQLQTGDLLKLPNDSWLEVAIGEDCFGGGGAWLYGTLEYLYLPSDYSTDKQIWEEREAGKIHPTIASYLR